MKKFRAKPANISQEDWDAVDSPEWTAGDFKRARPAKNIVPAELMEAVAAHRKRGERGPQKAPVKVPIKLRIDPSVLEAYKADGPGYQTRMAEILRKAIVRKKPPAANFVGRN